MFTISDDVHKRVKMLKAKFSAKKRKALTWDEFFELLLNRERKKEQLKSWLYTLGIFVAITLILVPTIVVALFIEPLAAMSMLMMFLLIGFIVASFSAYVLTPWTLRKIKPFENTPPQVLKYLEELSKKAGLKKVPKLMLAVTPEINAMTYASISGNRVCVTRGLMEAYQAGKIDEEELKGILGHEIGHIKNLDCLKRSLVLSWISIFDTIGTIMMLLGQGIAHIRREGGWMGLAIALTGWMLYISGIIQKIIAKIASILAFHLSRKQEIAADELGAELTNPENIANALRKIDTLNNELVSEKIAMLPYADRWQLQPRNPSWIDKLFDTHPPMEKREDALKQISEFL